MSALARIARVTGLLLVALVAVFAAAGGVLWMTTPPPPGLPASFAVPAPETPVTQPALRTELMRRFALDQAVREQAEMSDLNSLANPRSLWRMGQTVVQMLHTDRPNQARVRQVTAEGWPTADEIGPDGMNALFYLVQHSDIELMRAALPGFRDAWREGALEGQHLALLTDRIRIQSGEPQLYGSQMAITLDGLAVAPIEDADGVDARRAALGMPPLAEYLDLACREAEICAALPS